MDSVFVWFNKSQKYIYFLFLAAGFCPINLAFALKITVLPESGVPVPWARSPHGRGAPGELHGIGADDNVRAVVTDDWQTLNGTCLAD